ncbi:thiamine phosphate synthase [bacterium]
MIDKNSIDYSLYVIIDQDWIRDKDLVKLTEEIVCNGATILQYRNKSGCGSQFYENAGLIHKVSKSYQIPLIINDRADIAMAVDAEGVHVGQEDMPISAARQLIGSEKLLGLSISYINELSSIGDADYLGVGAVFPTDTKLDAEFGGIQLMKQVHEHCDLPLVGIGGIDFENTDQVIHAGAEGVAVISVILNAEDPGAAAKQMVGIVRQIKQDLFNA